MGKQSEEGNTNCSAKRPEGEQTKPRCIKLTTGPLNRGEAKQLVYHLSTLAHHGPGKIGWQGARDFYSRSPGAL